MSLSHRFAQLYQFAFKQRQIQNVILSHAVFARRLCKCAILRFENASATASEKVSLFCIFE